MNWISKTLLLAASLIGGSCGHYSFTGVSISAKTIEIDDFYNNTTQGPANLGQTFTNSLKDYFLQNSSLSITTNNAELQLQGEITDFRLSQVAPTASTTNNPNQQNLAALSRLTITVKVTYINTLDDTMSFKDRSFSYYGDFSNDQNLIDVQDRLISDIFEQIITDMFNASIANW